MNYKKIKIKDACDYSLFNKIKRHALGSFYRLNARSADCYAFNITKHGTDWDGGWDWSSNLVDTDADFILKLDTLQLYKIIK